MSVIVATAYMEEADRFDWLVAMDAGTVLATSMPESLRTRIAAGTGNTGVACGPESLRTLIATASLEEAFITLLPEEKRRGHRAGWYRPWRPRSRPRSPSRSRG